MEDGGHLDRKQPVNRETADRNPEGEANKPPDKQPQQESPVDGPGKSGAGDDDLGETSQDEPGS